MCLTLGVYIIYYILLYITIIIHILLYYLILYSSLLLIYLLFSHSFSSSPLLLCSLPSPSLPSLPLSSSPSSPPLIQSIRVGTSIFLLIFQTHLPHPLLFLSSFKVYVSVLTYTLFIFSSKYLTPHVLSEWMVEV